MSFSKIVNEEMLKRMNMFFRRKNKKRIRNVDCSVLVGLDSQLFVLYAAATNPHEETMTMPL